MISITSIFRQLVASIALLTVAGLGAPGYAQTAPVSEPVPVAFSPQAASVEQIYTIADLSVDEQAETSAQARDTALGVARRLAFSRLARRLVLSEDMPRLPTLNDAQLLDIIAGIEVSGEKTRNRRYIARLTIRFAADQVRQLLTTAGIKFSETSTAPIVLLPVFESVGGRVLWEPLNPWRDALGAALTAEGVGTDRLLPLYLPQGDFQDFTAISAEQAITADPTRIGAIAARYGVKDVIVAHAVMSAAAIDINWRRYGAAGETASIDRFEITAGETPESAMARAASAIIRTTQENWKRETALDFNENASVLVSAQLPSLPDWLAMQKLLGAVPMIRQVDVRELSVNQAQLILHILGTPEKLQAALLKQALILEPAENGWTLRKQ